MTTLLSIILSCTFYQAPSIDLIINGKDTYELTDVELKPIELPKTISVETQAKAFSVDIILVEQGGLLWKSSTTHSNTIKIPEYPHADAMILKFEFEGNIKHIYSIPLE